MGMNSKSPTDGNARLLAKLPSARLAPFLQLAAGDIQLAGRLYVWNRDLSVAFLADIAVLEVALRNAMHDAATNKWGPRWYETLPLDRRSERQVHDAWKRLPATVRDNSHDPEVPGRFVANCMFGFWTNLLDKGSPYGDAPRKIPISYDTYWLTAFKYAFPGGRAEARRLRKVSGQNEPEFTRQWAHGICSQVNTLRNRVAHHEALINGVPLTGTQLRLTPAQSNERCVTLAHMLDRDLAAWLSQNSRVAGLLAAKPQ